MAILFSPRDARLYLGSRHERSRFRDQVVAAQDIGASRLASASYTGPSSGPDARLKLESYKTRLRHWLHEGDRYDLKTPEDQEMIWSYMYEIDPRRVAAFIKDSPPTLLADQFVAVLGPPSAIVTVLGPPSDAYTEPRENRLVGVYHVTLADLAGRAYLEISALRDKPYLQAHLVFEPYGPDDSSPEERKARTILSGFVLDYGDDSASTMMVLRDTEFNQFSHWFFEVRRFAPQVTIGLRVPLIPPSLMSSNHFSFVTLSRANQSFVMMFDSIRW
jgi:hypothetical protein